MKRSRMAILSMAFLILVSFITPSLAKQKYRFTQISEIGQGYDPAINNLGEIVYLRLDNQGGWQVFSTTRGWLGFNGAFLDINDAGEIVYQAPGITSNRWAVYSTGRGLIQEDSASPSINNNGEIVYQKSLSVILRLPCSEERKR